MSLYLNLTIPSFFRKTSGNSPRNWWRRLPFDRSIEVEYGEIDDTLLTFILSTEFKGSDHAGPKLELSVFGYGFRIEIPKARHWNHDDNCWMPDWNTYMNQCINLAKERKPDDDFYSHDFDYYYNKGYSPVDAVDRVLFWDGQHDD